MTPVDFSKGCAILAAGIGREIKTQQIQAWYPILSDLTVEQWGYAVQRYLAESDSAWPMPAQLRKLASEFTHGVHSDHGEAFAKVTDAVRVYGSYQADKAMASFDEATRRAVQACGGFMWFCEMDSDNRQTMAAQFRMAYQQAQQRTEKHQALPERLRPRMANEIVKGLAQQMKGIE